MAYIAFIALGMPDGLLGVAWPSIRASFSIPLDAVGGLLFAAVAGYLTSSFSSGYLIGRLGVGRVLAASCALTRGGLIGYTLVGGFQIALAACFALTLPMWNQKDPSTEGVAPKRLTDYKTPMGETLRQPRVWLSVLIFHLKS